MDLGKLNTRRGAEEGAELELVHFETREPLGIFIRLRGLDSTVFRDQMIANQRRMRSRLVAEKRAEASGAEIEADAVSLLAACTQSWRDAELGKPVLEIDGAELECTPDNARRVYTEFTWIREQVDAFVGDRANFLQRSGTSSSDSPSTS